MRRMEKVIAVVVVAGISCWLNMARAAEAEDVVYQVKLSPPESVSDTRYAYKKRILVAALEASVAKYGPYTLESPSRPMTAARTFHELNTAGSSVNLTFALTNEDRERIAIPIRIPIRKGLLNYRLVIVRKADVPEFMRIASVEDLKAKVVGQSNGWVTAEVLLANDFNVAIAQSREHLFPMLRDGRFDYLLYGVNEAFKEIKLRADDGLELVVVPGLAVHINLPLYFFVAPHQSHLAKRLEDGLEIIIANGKLDALFRAEYGGFIQKAELASKKILYVDNPSLSPLTPMGRSELWFSPSSGINSGSSSAPAQ